MKQLAQLIPALVAASTMFAAWGCGSSDSNPTPPGSDAGATGGTTGSTGRPTGSTGGTTGSTGGTTGAGACARMPMEDGTISITGSNTMGFGASPAKLLVSVVANNRVVTWNGGFESRLFNGTTQCRASASLDVLGAPFTAGKVFKVAAPNDVTITSAPPAVPMGAPAADYAAAFVHEWSDTEKTMSVLTKRVSYRATGGTITVKSVAGKVVTLTLNLDLMKVEGTATTGTVITVTGETKFETL